MITRETMEYILSAGEYAMAKLEYREFGDSNLHAVLKWISDHQGIRLDYWKPQYHEELPDGFRIILSSDYVETMGL
jgi:hypothetical protein